LHENPSPLGQSSHWQFSDESCLASVPERLAQALFAHALPQLMLLAIRVLTLERLKVLQHGELKINID